MTMPTRGCMLCRTEHLKGFFRHRTDPICIEGMQRIRLQRHLLAMKYKAQEREARSNEAQ